MAIKFFEGISLKTLLLFLASGLAVVVIVVIIPTVTSNNNSAQSTSSSTTSNPSVPTLTQSLVPGICPNGNAYYITFLSDAEKIEVVNAHNYFRSLIAMGNAPNQIGATDMLEMVWSDEIAVKAQYHADKCVFEHDTSADRATTNFPSVGQNLAYRASSSRSSSYNITNLVRMWYNEVLITTSQVTLSPFSFNSAIGHYTQVAWATSYALGCGFKKYLDTGSYRCQLTCNYGPAGNMISGRMYTGGTFSAAGCVHGASTQWPGLCKSS